jgi:c-di-AMP phosphodiesterase-like protein
MPSTNGKILDKLTLKSGIHLAVILVLLVILCIYDLKWIIPSILIYAILVVYTIMDNSKKKNEIVNHIQELTSDMNTATKKNLINSPIPLIIVETDGHIIWKSKKFVDEFQNLDMATYLTPILKEIKIDLEKNDENDEKEEISKQFNIGKKVYKIRGGVAKSKKKDKRDQKEYVLTLYFIDDTKYNELFDDYNNSKICIGIATIDNYEEIVKRALPDGKLELISKVEKEIFNWANEIGGLVIKTDTDNFIYIFEQQYLPKIEEEKFEILDKVKSLDNNVQVTLSIAVSNEGKTNYDRYKSAMTAMDIVIGRGGDQAIVRRDGKYKFYGGTTLEVEKRSKVKARTIAHSISDLIQEADKVIIMGHTNIDIDALGSAIGMYRLSKTLEKECYIASEPEGKNLDKFLDELHQNEEYNDMIIDKSTALEKITPETLLIIVDTHKTNFVEFPELLEKTDKKVIIDHHRKVTDYIENPILSFHEVYASSTAELVTEILQYSKENVELNLIEAEALYGGIMVDTKDFTFKTGVRTFEAAAYLRKFGVDIIKVKKWFQADFESYNIIAEIVKNTEIINDSIAVATYSNLDDKSANLICAKAADELLTISDITASFVIGKVGDKVFISGRSIGDINVQLILEKLGGGGHITLAGAQLEGFSIEEAKQELLIRIDEYFAEIG